MSALDRYALRRTVREAGQALVRAGVASPEVDARLLAEHLLGGPVLLADGAPEDFAAAYAQLVERRAAREPLQHILGVMWFRGLELACRPGVFIVRPETEVVAGAAIDAARAIAPGRRPASSTCAPGRVPLPPLWPGRCSQLACGRLK
ncbi:hypothetical protein [Actinomyces sp. 432]|uniref:hypothetical protein n=1 Tax=Actinomyces sp. 432 TaxID=2057798 RepID=UPI003FA48247